MKNLTILIFYFFSFNQFYTQKSLDSLRLVLPLGHTAELTSAVFSPDGKLVLTSSVDGTARIYDVISGKELRALIGHKSGLTSAVFSPDGKLVLTASSDDSTARIYDVMSGKELRALIGHKSGLTSAVFSPDGKLVLTASSDSTARIYDVISGKELNALIGHKSELRSAVFSPDGKLVLTASDADSTARIYEISTAKELNALTGHKNGVFSTAFSPDGNFILTTSDNIACIFEVISGKLLQVFVGHTDYISSAVFSPDGNFVLTASWDKTARIYEVISGKLLQVFVGHADILRSAVFSPDGSLVLTASHDKTACIFEARSGKLTRVLRGHTNSLVSAIFSPDSKLVLTASDDKTACIFEARSGILTRVLKGHTNSLRLAAFSPDGKLFLAAILNNKVGIYDEVGIYDVASGKQLQVLIGHKDDIRSVEFSPNSQMVLTSSYDGTVRIYEVSTGKQIQVLWGQNAGPHSAIFSPDNKFVLTASDDNIARIYDVSSAKELKVLNGHIHVITSIDFSPDGRLALTSSYDKTVRVYDVRSGEEILVIKHNRGFASAVFSPDGKLLAMTSLDEIVKIYDIGSGKELHVFRNNTSALFSPDGKMVICENLDSTIRIYDVYTGKEIMNLRMQAEVYSIFSPDCKYVIVCDDNSERIYELSSGKEQIVRTWNQSPILSTVYSLKGNLGLHILVDGKFILWEVSTGNIFYERLQLENNNWLIKLPNSPYYMCSKDASKMLHYVTPSLKVIGFEQLDPVYNRPDIVLDDIGKYFGGADQKLIANYRKSWEKRINKLGLDAEKLVKGEIAVPSVKIVGADQIANDNIEGQISIDITAKDSKYRLRRFNVYVNEVPLYGSAGVAIAHLNKLFWDSTVSVPLSVGENKIQVSVMNELGLENFKYPIYVNYSPKEEFMPRTIYIGIGVDEFLQSEHNLKFCVKDVRDLAKVFSSENYFDPSIMDENSNTDTILFINKQVTKENILALKTLLSQTTVNDKVIISCSSHGLLDDSLNFYLAMHDVDFENPKARGLKYEELESLFDGIPARQKLLLLDACNSGENDQTELLKKELEVNKTKMDTNQLLAARSVVVELEEENTNNFKKMSELYVNVRNNTGSVIISAAGGQQSALEAIEVDGKIIENGAFTYSILECLKQNQGQLLKVNTLKQYAEKRVEEITDGKQKPTSRQETMEIDWGVR